MKPRATSGITLLELLIAMTLLSLLSVGILYSFRIGLNAMSRSNARITANRRVVGVERAMAEQLANFVPVYAHCKSGPEAPIQRLMFFQGDLQTMRFVSTYSLQEAARGYPRILEFQVIPGENGEGVRLIVNERLYTGPLSTGALCLGLMPDPSTGTTPIGFRPVEIGTHSFILADRLASCSFAYKEQLGPDAPINWRARWHLAAVPLAVRIDMQPLEPSPAKLHVPSFVVPFRVDRHLDENFVDWQ